MQSRQRNGIIPYDINADTKARASRLRAFLLPEFWSPPPEHSPGLARLTAGFFIPEVSMYRFFTREELQCRCGCGVADMDPGFMHKLIELRDAARFPFVVTSAYRCPAHNARVSQSGTSGAHTTGRAIDIAVSHERALWIVSSAVEYGFTGVGVQQKGGGRFLHLDDLAAPNFPRPNIWSYP